MTIAVAYRPDEFGRAALEWAITQAENTGDSLVVVSVDSEAEASHIPGVAAPSLAAGLDDRGVEYEIRQAVGNDVAEAVLFEAEQAGAGLIVVGTRRRSPVGKALLGSTAQALILDASVPVVAVKP